LAMGADRIPTVLVSDDESANLGVLFEHLRHTGLKTLVAQSGHAALQVLERFRPDIVLLDIMLPDIDGFELCREIRNRSKDPDIPVIFLSALSDTETKIRALEMDAETLTRMFDPFFSTQFMGRGMGLPTVAGIVRSHKGAILVDSRPGKGTTVRVLLPVAGDPNYPMKADPDAAARDTQIARSCSFEALTVLLAEDDDMFRRMAQAMLVRLGYTVITARDGAEAVEIFRQHEDRIACVLLDLTMPRLNGWEALQSIRAIRSDVPLILTSGYDEAQTMEQYHAERPQAFLQKPYQLVKLQEVVADAVREFRPKNEKDQHRTSHIT
jgi:CheY-like chemotaxis protein